MKKTPPYTEAVINLWMSSTSISRKIDVSLGAIHGIGFTEFMVLFHLMNAPNNTMRFFSRWRTARRRTNGSATARILSALITLVFAPNRSRAFCMARAQATARAGMMTATYSWKRSCPRASGSS